MIIFPGSDRLLHVQVGFAERRETRLPRRSPGARTRPRQDGSHPALHQNARHRRADVSILLRLRENGHVPQFMTSLIKP